MGYTDNEDMEEKSVYEEWRTYPPVPEIKKETKVQYEPNKDIKTDDRNISDGETKK